MANNKQKSQNIVTAAVVAVAVILLALVVVTKTGILSPNRRYNEGETVIETEIVLVSETREDGEIIYYTMLNEYIKPKITSNHKYPVTKGTTTTQAETTSPFIEATSVVQLCDENGIPQFNEKGEPITQILDITVPNTAAETQKPKTTKVNSVQVTDAQGNAKLDENGNPITEINYITEVESTKADIWEGHSAYVETTTKKFNIDIGANVSRDDGLAETIVAQLNEDRASQGLSPLTSNTSLTASARTNSLALAVPSLYNQDTKYSNKYTTTTTYGGKSLYTVLSAGCKGMCFSDGFTNVGVGVVKSDGKYYTTIIFS